MQIIDTHTHLYAKEFDADRTALIQKAIEEGVTTFLLPNIDSEWTAPMLELEAQYPKNCLPMMGLHPCSVKEDYKAELRFAEDQLSKHKFYGIGEMGIDLFWDKTFIKEQDLAFEEQSRWAQQLDLPLAIHSREATTHAIKLIHKLNLPSLKGVFHCFTGTLEEAQEIIKMGFMLGIGGVATFKNGGLDKILPSIAIEHIVLETDAPYLAPTPHRGKRNEPSFIKLVAEKTASIYNIPVEEFCAATTANAKRLFNL